MTHDITLKFGSQFDDAGWKKLDTAMHSSAGAVRNTSRIFAAMGEQMGALGGKAGAVAKQIGGMVGSILSGGWWGLAIAGISALVGVIVKWINSTKEAEEATKKAGEELDKLGEKAKRAALDVQDFSDSLEMAKMDKTGAALEQVNKEIDKYEELEQKIKAASFAETQRYERLGKYNIAINQAQAAVAAAQGKLETAQFNARVYGGDANAVAVQNAMKELELATIKLQAAESDKADAEREHAKVVRQREEAEQAAIEALAAENEARQAEYDRELEAAERKQSLEGMAERDTEEYKAKQAEIAKEMQALQKQSAKWEEAAARARGKSFDDYYKNERRANAQAERDAKKEENWQRVAQEEFARLQARGTAANAGSNRADERRMAYLQDYLNAQDAANNPFDAAIAELKLQAASLESTFRDEMAKIRMEIDKFTMQ